MALLLSCALFLEQPQPLGCKDALSRAGEADSEVLRLMTDVAEASRQRVAVEAQLAAVQRSDSVARGQLEQARVRGSEL